MITKINKIVMAIIKIIRNGLTILTPVEYPMKYPKNNKTPRLNNIVKSRPRISCFNRSDFWILGGIVPI